MAACPSVDAFIANERAQSPMLGGRSVFGWEEDLMDGVNEA
jgi:hypothetical protein